MEKQDNIPKEKRDEKLENFAKRNKSKKKILKYISIPAVIVAVIVFTVVCFVFFFKIRTVEIDGAKKYNAESLKIKSGIEIGKNLYSFKDEDIEKALTLSFPYISDVKITRRWPDKVIVTVTEESAKYVTEVYGETLILSPSLRVLENPSEPAENYNLCYLILPDIERALVGSTPVFTADGDYLLKALKEIDNSPLNDRITAISLKNKFDLCFLMGNTYKVDLGNTDELSIKLDMTDKIIESGHIKDGQKAELDVSNPVECTAIIGENAVITLD